MSKFIELMTTENVIEIYYVYYESL